VLAARLGHLNWLFDTGERRTTACGREVEMTNMARSKTFWFSMTARYIEGHSATRDILGLIAHNLGGVS